MKTIHGYLGGSPIMARMEYFVAIKMTSGVNDVRRWGQILK